ncbi:intein [Hypnocyclicus thermotrophus]|uniref:Intein n=1 Tax=Hypnocyclicus thermotrophus TaxID=1627895 RepID=A0AA46DZG1_9FUSO|nr:hypothetical protein [Hypnocyclicus thermotrophus]TDT71735.1 intein [Hypnocyclicus thermotrophus]
MLYFLSVFILIIASGLLVYLIKNHKKIKDFRKGLEKDLNTEKIYKYIQMKGYKIIQNKVYSYYMLLNGKYAEIQLKPELTVTKNGKKYAVIINKDKEIEKNTELRKKIAEIYYTGYFFGVIVYNVNNTKLDKIIYVNRKERYNKKVFQILIVIIMILSTLCSFYTLNFFLNR